MTSHNIIWISFDNLEFDEITMNKLQCRLKLILTLYSGDGIIVWL